MTKCHDITLQDIALASTESTYNHGKVYALYCAPYPVLHPSHSAPQCYIHP